MSCLIPGEEMARAVGTRHGDATCHAVSSRAWPCRLAAPCAARAARCGDPSRASFASCGSVRKWTVPVWRDGRGSFYARVQCLCPPV